MGTGTAGLSVSGMNGTRIDDAAGNGRPRAGCRSEQSTWRASGVLPAQVDENC